MKRNVIKFISTFLIITILPFSVLGNEKNDTKIDTIKEIVTNKEEVKGNYVTNIGKIEEVSKYEKDVSILVKNNKEDKYGTLFNIYDETLVLDITTMKKIDPKKLKAGDKVKICYDVNTKSLKSLPEQITPEVIILLKNEEEPISVYVDNFDKNGLSSDKNIKISSLEESEIVDINGKTIQKDEVLGKDLVIFYSITTRSLPPQTAPKKIIVLKNKKIKENNIIKEDTIQNIENDINKKVKEIINYIKEENIFKKEKDTFVPLYLVAENLGYNLTWEEDTKKIIMKKDSSNCILEIDSKNYTINDNKEQFKHSPFIKNNRTYVEQNFIEKLVK